MKEEFSPVHLVHFLFPFGAEQARILPHLSCFLFTSLSLSVFLLFTLDYKAEEEALALEYHVWTVERLEWKV